MIIKAEVTGINWAKCDFCGAMITEKDCGANTFGFWRYGQRGFVVTFGFSGYVSEAPKHSCTDELCKAKLLVWARS